MSQLNIPDEEEYAILHTSQNDLETFQFEMEKKIEQGKNKTPAEPDWSGNMFLNNKLQLPTFDFNIAELDEADGTLDKSGPQVISNGAGPSRIGMDGMINHENEEVRDRVGALEKKVQLQEDEIVCLKSALSDVIRRLGAIESSRSSNISNSVLPSKPFRATPKKSTPSSPAPRRSSSTEPISRAGPITPNRIVPRASTGTSPSLKKWPSVPSTAESAQNGHITPSSSLASGREPVYNQDEGSVRIYLRGRPITMWAPTNVEDYQIGKVGQAPSEKLRLEWVYGYRGRDSRSNLYLLPTGEVIYFAAAVVVLYNVEEQMQRHYLGHTDDVKCIAVHPDKITIATGQVAGHDKKEGRPHVRIWDSVSLNTLHVIGIGDFDRAVCCVAFSKTDSGQYLCAVDEANEHILSVWEWQKGERGHKITETKSSQEPVLAAEFHPYERNVIVTCGKNQISFWNLEGGTVTKKQGIFEKLDKPKYVTCLAFADNGDVLSGDSNGNIFIWGRGTNRVSQTIKAAHEGGIFSLCAMKDGTIISGGGKDRKIKQWDANYTATGKETELPEVYGPVRMLSQGKGNMILVGTTKNAILQGTLELEFSPIVQGHLDELWGLATHPNQHQFISCGYDRNVYLWDTLTHSVIWQKEVTEGSHCACFHPNGNVVAIGSQLSRWYVIDVTTHDVITSHSDGNEQIECIQYSPDGKYIALGSRDNYIYVYQVSEDGRKYSRVGKCSGHSSFVLHVDWDVDSQYIQSNSGDYEILYWAAATCKQVVSGPSMRDVQWATHNCTLGFNVCGIWPEGADGTDVNACSVSNKKQLVSSADDFGKVNLFKYPCSQPKSSCHTYNGHSSHVTCVKFMYDDSRLLSTGGKDMAVLQWEVL